MNKTIKILREKNNYSQVSVAEYLGISRQMYIKYETGAVELSVKTIKALSALYKVSAEVIFDDKLACKNSDAEFSFDDDSASVVGEPEVQYGVSVKSQVVKLLEKLELSEQIEVMAKLASMIQKKSSVSEKTLPQKNKKIPYEEYVRMMNQDEK